MERTTGWRTILGLPAAYELCQRAMGSPNVRRETVHRYLRPRFGDAILDIGCGTGAILPFLPGVSYVGFDPNPAYVEAARGRYADRAHFFVGTAGSVDPVELGTFDLVLTKGVLHHVDDGEAVRLFELAHTVLKPSGRLVTVDACWSPNQSAAARAILRRDRGATIRNLEGYRELGLRVFNSVEGEVRHDLLRIPYTHVFLEWARDGDRAA